MALWMRNGPQRLIYWTFGLHLMMLSGELIEPLEVRALMKKDYHCGWALKIYNLALLSSCSFSFLCAAEMWSFCFLPQHAPLFPTMMESVPLEPGAKIDPFFLKFFWVMAFYHSSRIHTHLSNFTLWNREERDLKDLWRILGDDLLGPTRLVLGVGIKMGTH